MQRFLKRNKSHVPTNRFNKYNNEYIGDYSLGKAFKGKHVGDKGEEYGKHSTTIEINGLPSKGLLRLAGIIAKVLQQENVLVKDLNDGTIYRANGFRDIRNRPRCAE